MSINTTSMSISELVEAIKTENDSTIKDTMVQALREKVKADNDANIKVAVETFAHYAAQNVTAFFDAFLTDATVGVKKVSQDAKTMEWKVTDARKTISFTEVEKVFRQENGSKSLARSMHYVGLTARFLHNLYVFTCSALSEDAKKVAMSKYNGPAITEADFAKASKSQLHKQLQAIVDEILPEGYVLKMNRADVNALILAFTRNKELDFKTVNEAALLRSIFAAMRTRKAGRSYSVESKAACHKAKESNQTPAQEERTSKIPERAEAEQTLSPNGSTKATNVA